MRPALLTIPFLLFAGTALAQDTLTVTLPAVQVEASRGAYSSESAPVAVAVLARPEVIRRSEPALALESILTELPGLWVADRSHLAIGERLVVRGLGSRAAFGVRSVAVLLDGVMLTMPDGQAVLDPVEPALVSRAELIRGPASRFWGNAAGGVLVLESGRLAGDASGLRLMAGSQGTRQVVADVSGTSGATRGLAWGSILDRDGFRDHAAGRIARLGLRGSHSLASGAVVAFSVNGSDLDTESPGSLTLEQWQEDPSAADARYVNTSSGKRATQFQASIGLTTPIHEGVLSASAFGLQRSLDNPLPFAFIDLNRSAFGARADWRGESNGMTVGVGADFRRQSDDRINADNADGIRGSDVDLDQTEVVSGLGVSVIADASVADALTISAGVRLDQLTVRMDDHLTSNGDASGSENFLALSPSAGITYAHDHGSAFASVSTAFEIPTTTELVNRPDGLGGFNPNLDPQRIVGIEAGFRHVVGRAFLDVALYQQRLTNFLSPYQLESFPGRIFYRNVGKVRYSGVEVAAAARIKPWLRLDGTLSAHRYAFDSGDLKDKRVPGIPMRFGSMRVQGLRGPLVGSVRLRAGGSQWADDENTVEIDGFAALDLRLGLSESVGTARMTPFLEVTNLLDGDHVISIVPNARGGRYYEGLPGRSVQVGVSLTY